MKHHTFLIPILLILLCLTSCAQPQYSKEELQLRDEIAQMLVVGFRGTQLSHHDHIVRDIKDYHIGGVILFEYDAPSGSRPRNIESPKQLERLCKELQHYSKTPLLISIDQEGGKVCRLKSRYGFPYFASAQSTAQSGPDSVRYYASLTAHWLHQMGINLNFAPCVDVNINPECPVIGKIERSFSANPELVAQCAEIWIDEQNKKGVISCLKHFPGHGSSKADTHAGYVDVSESWVSDELIPYRKLIAAGKVDMIMTTHVFNRQLDTLNPATLSPYILTTLLRDSLHFTGVVITDDLAMGAMSKYYTTEEVLLRAINAGADMLCLSNNKDYDEELVPNTIDIIFNLVKEGKIARERITEAATRIGHLKQTRL